jgi:hypothetical protein
MDEWKSKLIEGKTYNMQNFKVGDCSGLALAGPSLLLPVLSGTNQQGHVTRQRTCSTRSILLDNHPTDHDFHVLLNSMTRVTLSLSTILASWNGSTRLRNCNVFSCIHTDIWQLSGFGLLNTAQ